MHLVGFATEIYRDARSQEHQVPLLLFDIVLKTAISLRLRLSVFVTQTVTYQDILWQLSSNHEEVQEQLVYWSSRL